jgi:hypothetical protein
MGDIVDFIMGRNNKLLRDMLAACSAIAIMSVVAMTYINQAVETFRTSRQPLPSRTQIVQNTGNTQLTTITRSVLDDPVVTGSISGRPIILDPCTGKEKR